MEPTATQHRTWSQLYHLLWPRLQAHACREWHAGHDALGYGPDRIPDLAALDRQVHAATGWRLVPTSERHSDPESWYRRVAAREFLVTDHVRDPEELQYTPEPDLLHDLLGHVPYFLEPRFTAVEELFAPAFLRADRTGREALKQLAWYSTEFGLLRQDGELKVFGAGLVSSAGEIDRVVGGEVEVRAFRHEDVLAQPRSVWDFNRVLYATDSLEEYRHELERALAALDLGGDRAPGA
jgi:phenylalanine-4-hydroxylase